MAVLFTKPHYFGFSKLFLGCIFWLLLDFDLSSKIENFLHFAFFCPLFEVFPEDFGMNLGWCPWRFEFEILKKMEKS